MTWPKGSEAAAKCSIVKGKMEATLPSGYEQAKGRCNGAGSVAQYELFGEQNLIPSEFEECMSALSPEVAVDGYFILEPEVG